MKEAIVQFFSDVWSLASAKHEQSIYNTLCLAVLVTLPLVVLFTSLLVCCHCCCARHCRRGKAEASPTRVSEKKKKKKKKNGSQNSEDLWISVKADPMSSDRLALTAV